MRTPTTCFRGCVTFCRHVQGVFTVLTVLCLPNIVRGQETSLFGEPQVLFEHTDRIAKAILTNDGLTLYFCEFPVDDILRTAIWEAKRPTRSDPFGGPTRLGPVVNRGSFAAFPDLSRDNRRFYFSVGHVPEDAQIFVARRSPEGHIDGAVALDVGRTAYMGCVSPDSRSLFFTAGALWDRALWVARFNVPGEPESGFNSIEKLGAPNLPADEWPPCISPDGLVLLWSHRPWNNGAPVPPGHGGADLWMAYRASSDAPFGAPVNLPSPPNASGAQTFPFVPADGRTLVFSTLGKKQIWEADACFAADITVAYSISDDPTAGEDVVFDATASLAAEGAIASYEWRFGDGDVAEGVRVSHRYDTARRYRVTLVVRSDQDACNHRSELITIACPADGATGWTSTDVGEPAFPGSVSVPAEDDGCITICAGGSFISGTSDQFHFVHQESTGDAVLTAQLSQLAGDAALGNLGVMLRESLDSDARYASVFVEGISTKQFRFRYRESTGARGRWERGGMPVLPDAWVQIRRVGSELSGFSSADGENWTEISHASIDFPGAFLAGVAASGREGAPYEPYVPLTAMVCNLQLDLSTAAPSFVRGDCNSDGTVNISDATCILNWLFAGQADPGCVAAMNTTGDDAANISDATYLLNHLFSEGPAPVAPFPDCGPGALPADAELGCANPPDCQ